MFFEKNDKLLIGRFAGLYGESSVLYAMSTRMGGVSLPPYDSLNLGQNTDDSVQNVETNRKRFFDALDLPIQQISLPQQVHSKNVRIVDKPGQHSQTDGLITSTPEVALIIQVADCLPIALVDPAKNVIGLVHAGWKGSQLGIGASAVQMMVKEFGCHPTDISGFLGPSIGPCCYEVGNEFFDYFPSQYIINQRLNLWLFNHDQLVAAGLLSEKVQISRICTKCHSNWFYSHRGSGGKAGRMMATLMIKDKALDI